MLFVIWVQAQDNNSVSHVVKLSIPDVALVDAESEGNTEIVLTDEAPTEGGEAMQVEQAINNSLWLNYSVSLDPNAMGLIDNG